MGRFRFIFSGPAVSITDRPYPIYCTYLLVFIYIFYFIWLIISYKYTCFESSTTSFSPFYKYFLTFTSLTIPATKETQGEDFRFVLHPFQIRHYTVSVVFLCFSTSSIDQSSVSNSSFSTWVFNLISYTLNFSYVSF
jgi:hypothetical protein